MSADIEMGKSPAAAQWATGVSRPVGRDGRTRLADVVYEAVAPAVFHLLRAGSGMLGGDAEQLRQRAGVMPDCGAPCLWLHGASAGEMAAAANLVALLRERSLRFATAYTTTNAAGLRLIERRVAPGDVSALAPWDAPRWVARAFDHWRPAALILLETELWPAMIRAAAQRGVPVLCASARIYPRDVPRYRLIRRFLRPSLDRLTAVLAQNDTERQRFVELGVAPERCRAAGNLKHLGAGPRREDVAAFRHAIGLTADERVWVVGSLHGDEASFLWSACERMPPPLPRLIVAPRHHRDVAAIEAGARRRGWAVRRRSAPAGAWQVLLLDSMGELRTAYAAATLAVVGGSFAAHGGHDLMEPLRCGVPVLFGRHTGHVEAEASALSASLPSSRVDTPEALAAAVAGWWADDRARGASLDRQRAALPDPVALGELYGAAIAPWLPACRTVNEPPSS